MRQAWFVVFDLMELVPMGHEKLADEHLKIAARPKGAPFLDLFWRLKPPDEWMGCQWWAAEEWLKGMLKKYDAAKF